MSPIHSIEVRKCWDGGWVCVGYERVPGRRRKMVQYLHGRSMHQAVQAVRLDQRNNP